MCGKKLETREVIVDGFYSFRRRIIISVVSAVYEQRQPALYYLVYLESLRGICIELLEIWVKLDSVKSQLLYLNYVSLYILGIGMCGSEAVKLRMQPALSCNECIYRAYLSR